jgi:dTDP-4-dehydrorhamnose 3,5-epimerase
MFIEKPIEGVIIRDLKKHIDVRGWLCELFRSDETEEIYHPEMAYLSMTHADIQRGPHEHKDQADFFCFIGPSNFKVFLWDNRRESPTYEHKMVVVGGEDSPKSVIIPPGVVHAYKNIGGKFGMVVNCPNRLFSGRNRKEPVDEIRHEDDPETIFKLE